MRSEEPSKIQLVKALRKLERNPNSKERILGDIGITLSGGALGAAAGTTVATAVGATSIWGLTNLASWFGITIVNSTPVGWFIGLGALGATLGYATSRLIRGGAYSEGKLKQLKLEIQDRLKQIERLERASQISETDITHFDTFLREPVERGLIPAETAYRLITSVEMGEIDLKTAYVLVNNILNSMR